MPIPRDRADQEPRYTIATTGRVCAAGAGTLLLRLVHRLHQFALVVVQLPVDLTIRGEVVLDAMLQAVLPVLDEFLGAVLVVVDPLAAFHAVLEVPLVFQLAVGVVDPLLHLHGFFAFPLHVDDHFGLAVGVAARHVLVGGAGG